MIRKATINDIDTLSKIHVDTWLSTYTGLIPSEYLSKLSYSKSKSNFENIIRNKINEHIVAVEEYYSRICFIWKRKDR